MALVSSGAAYGDPAPDVSELLERLHFLARYTKNRRFR
jgi:hypothetical protein